MHGGFVFLLHNYNTNNAATCREHKDVFVISIPYTSTEVTHFVCLPVVSIWAVLPHFVITMHTACLCPLM